MTTQEKKDILDNCEKKTVPEMATLFGIRKNYIYKFLKEKEKQPLRPMNAIPANHPWREKNALLKTINADNWK
jgi:hypothetical protein